MKYFLRAARRRGERYRAAVRRTYAGVRADPRADFHFTRLTRDVQRMNTQPWDQPLHPRDYMFLLNLAGKLGALTEASQIHRHIAKCKLERNARVTVHLIRMYGRCHCPSRAVRCFNRLRGKTPAAYAALITALAQNSLHKQAHEFFESMLKSPLQPDGETFIAALSSCSGPQALEFGRELHARLGLNSLDSDPAVRRAVIAMYGRCAAPDLALDMFRRIEHPDGHSWVALIAALDAYRAVRFTRLFLLEGVISGGWKSQTEAFTSMLSRCTCRGDLREGEVIHRLIQVSGLMQRDMLLRQRVMKMYGRCCSAARAKEVFEEVGEVADGYMWNTLIRVYAGDRSKREVAVRMFERMRRNRVKVTEESLVTVLCCCQSFEDVKSVHAYLVMEHGGRIDEALMRELIIRKYRESLAVPDPWEKYRQLQARFKQGFY